MPNLKPNQMTDKEIALAVANKLNWRMRHVDLTDPFSPECWKDVFGNPIDGSVTLSLPRKYLAAILEAK